MSGRNKVAEQIQLQSAQDNQKLSQQQAGIAQSYLDLSKGELARRGELQQPLIDFNKAITSGNMDAAISAMGVPLGNIARSSKQTSENIFNTVPAGAGRDYALASVERDKGSQTAGALNSAFMQALTGNATMGTESLNAGLQQEGAAASAFGGATNSGYASAQTAGNLANQAAQRKATTMGFIGSLAGAGGSIARGFMSGGGGGGGGVTSGDYGMAPTPSMSQMQWAPQQMQAPYVGQTSGFGQFVSSGPASRQSPSGYQLRY